jgi:NAD-dependent DNA ligase
MEECPDILVYPGDKKARVLAVKGMAEKTAQVFVEGVEPFLAFLKEIGVQIGKFETKKEKEKELVVSSELKGKTIVLTGFRDAALEEELKKRGAKIGSSVSKNTFLVLVKDKKGGDTLTGKVKDAKELGIQIMSLDEFKSGSGNPSFLLK